MPVSDSLVTWIVQLWHVGADWERYVTEKKGKLLAESCWPLERDTRSFDSYINPSLNWILLGSHHT